MQKLSESKKRGKSGGNSQSLDGKTRHLSIITCFRFQEKGHFQYNRHLAKKAVASSGNEETLETHASEPYDSWGHNRTENGYPDTKAVIFTSYDF